MSSLLQPVGEAEALAAALAGLPHLPPVAGRRHAPGQRARLGLEALAAHAPEIVLVHDAARPVIPPDTVPDLLAALADADGAIPACPVADTLKRSAADGSIAATVPREGLFRAQTPQAFRFPVLLALHRAGTRSGGTDDASLLEAAGRRGAARRRARRTT